MTREEWNLVSRLEDENKYLRANEWIEVGGRSEPFLFATRFFSKETLREVAYYLPMLQPEGSLIIFRHAGGREWPDEALIKIGLK